MANELKQVYGSATTVISHAASLANNAYTYAGLASLTNVQLDNSTLDYPYARCVLDVPDTFGAAPTAGGGVNLYVLKEDVDGTSDDTPPPDSTALKNAQWVGFFPISAYDVAQRVTINISLLGIEKCLFFIENKTGQTMSYTSAAITVKVTPFTVVPT